MTQTLEQLSATATEGEWIVHEYSQPSERRMIWDAPSAKNMCIECVKPDDAAFITALVNAYRTGQLVAVQADDATELSTTERDALLIALHDAIRRPMGVVPASADPFYSPAMADRAEAIRALKSPKPIL